MSLLEMIDLIILLLSIPSNMVTFPQEVLICVGISKFIFSIGFVLLLILNIVFSSFSPKKILVLDLLDILICQSPKGGLNL